MGCVGACCGCGELRDEAGAAGANAGGGVGARRVLVWVRVAVLFVSLVALRVEVLDALRGLLVGVETVAGVSRWWLWFGG